MAKQIIVHKCKECPFYEPQVSFSGNMQFHVCIELMKSIASNIDEIVIFEECRLNDYIIEQTI